MAKAKTIKVTFIKSPSGSPYNLAYFVGDTASVDIETAKKLLDAGFIEGEKAADNKETATAKKTGEKR